MRRSFQCVTTQTLRFLRQETFSQHREPPALISRSVPSAGLNGLKRCFCSASEQSCWNCSDKTERQDVFFCAACGSLQDAPKQFDYFKLLSLENKFSLNSEDLTKKFRQLQSKVHPDKFSSKSDKEQQNSLEWSSLINKAYKTLLAPIERGEYILSVHGISLPQDNSALDKEFLMEMMERNEEVEEAVKDNILQLLEKVRTEMDEKSLELSEVFNQEDKEKAKSVLVEMKYLKSLEKAIKEKAAKLGAVR